MSKRMRVKGVVAAIAACLLVFCVALTSALAADVTYAEKPANGTTKGQPFRAGTGGSLTVKSKLPLAMNSSPW